MGLDRIKHQVTIAEAVEFEKKNLEECIKYAHIEHDNRIRNIELTYQGLALLDGAGFNVPAITKWHTTGTEIDVTQKDLPAVYKAIGRLEVSGKYLEDGKKGLMSIVLRSVNYPTIRLKYQKKIATRGKKLAGQKCKIVRRVRPRRVEYDVVCEV